VSAVNGETGDMGHPARPRRTQAERSRATRAALVDAGRRLFAERGYAATGREDIAAAAGVTRGALYHHFDGKPALFEAVYESLEASLLQTVAAAAMRGTTARERLGLGCHAFLDAALDPAVQRIVLLDGPAVLSVDTRRRIEETYALGLLRVSLDELVAEGVLPAGPVDPLAHVLLGALHAAAQFVAHATAHRRARREVGDALDVFLDRLLG
jgi:AcrR family transcriptional regulator